MGHQIGYWVGAAAVLGLFILAARLYLNSRPVIGSDNEAALTNMVIQARSYVGLFGTARPLSADGGFVTALSGRCDCAIDILLRADVDVSSTELLALCKSHRNIQLWVERHPRQKLGGHFLTVDDRHTIIGRPEMKEKVPPGQMAGYEFHSVPSLSRYMRRKLSRLSRDFAHRIDTTHLVEDIRRYARFTVREQGAVRAARPMEIAAVAAALNEPTDLAA